MRTISREYNLYPVSELPTKSQEVAHQEWLMHKEYGYSSDNRATLTEFENAFNLSIRDWSYDSCSYNYSFFTDLSGDIEQMQGIRLATYIINNHWHRLFTPKSYWRSGKNRKSRVFVTTDCTLTGYCADCAVLEPIYKFLERPNEQTTYYDLMDSCLDSFFKYCRDDMEQTEKLEYFIEESENNEWEYLESGKIFS